MSILRREILLRLGRKSDTCADVVAEFADACHRESRDSASEFHRRWEAWQITRADVSEEALHVIERHHVALWSRLPTELRQSRRALLFALDEYYRCCAALLLEMVRAKPEEAFGRTSNAIRDELRSRILIAWTQILDVNSTDGCRDMLHDLYEDLVPRLVRHQLGEYYTPRWLVEHVLDSLGFDGKHPARVLDPTCGSGAFLLAAIERIRNSFAKDCGCGLKALTAPRRRELLERVVAGVVGIDRNPIAVLAAKANYAAAVRDLLEPDNAFEPPVYLADALLDDLPIGRFEFIAGNPPWIAWDNLPNDYRDATKSLWMKYGLFSLSGNAARHGGGKKDLSSLLLYSAAERWLGRGGRLGFVVTQTLLQSKGAGDGFRRFRIGATGEDLQVLRVDDFVRAKPFPGASNWTATICLQKGASTTYPVDYFVWARKDKASRSVSRDLTGGKSELDKFAELGVVRKTATPIQASQRTSPWMIRDVGSSVRLLELGGPSDYRAHLGANTGGANGVYWLDVIGKTESGVLVRNVPQRGKAKVPQVECELEADLLYPLVRWSDVDTFAVRNSLYVLLVQDVETREGIPEATMVERYPKSLHYLRRFETQLRGRAAYSRYQDGTPFYSMYNVGRYTIGQYKVVWRRMDKRVRASVVQPRAGEHLDARPIVPQETCVLVSCDSLDEAHYVAAVMNSAPTNYLATTHSVRGGKGFGTPSMLDYVPLAKFRDDHEFDRELAELGRRLHQARTNSPLRATLTTDQQAWLGRIDELVAKLWSLDENDIHVMRQGVGEC